jgi:DNA-binding response OmpR family regulator
LAKVLVYSDPDMANLVPIVADAGHRVVEAYSSEEVVQLVVRDQFDILIIPDEATPINDIDLLPFVRKLVLGAIVVLGRGDELAMTTALLEGADAYLPYPVDPVTLRIRLQSLLRLLSRLRPRSPDLKPSQEDDV